jgi:hypothetical protein
MKTLDRFSPLLLLIALIYIGLAGQVFLGRHEHAGYYTLFKEIGNVLTWQTVPAYR